MADVLSPVNTLLLLRTNNPRGPSHHPDSLPLTTSVTFHLTVKRFYIWKGQKLGIWYNVVTFC